MKRLFIIAAALNLVLGSMWLLFPELMLRRWDVAADQGAMYMGRRYGMLFLGLAILLWVARAAGPSPARTGILAGGMFMTLGLAIMGIIGAVTGTVGPMIWISIGLEVLLCAAFLYYLVADRRAAAG